MIERGEKKRELERKEGKKKSETFSFSLDASFGVTKRVFFSNTAKKREK